MRMWNVEPKIICRKHLLGEHVELHMLVGSINKGKSLHGFAVDRLIEPKKIVERHEQLVAEMQRRGYNHSSPLQEFSLEHLSPYIQNVTVDTDHSLRELLKRCPLCLENYLRSKTEDVLKKL